MNVKNIIIIAYPGNFDCTYCIYVIQMHFLIPVMDKLWTKCKWFILYMKTSPVCYIIFKFYWNKCNVSLYMKTVKTLHVETKWTRWMFLNETSFIHIAVVISKHICKPDYIREVIDTRSDDWLSVITLDDM